MIWLWVLASILGFLAVLPLSSQANIPVSPNIWLSCSWLCIGAFFAVILLNYFGQRRFFHKEGNSGVKFFTYLFAFFTFIALMLGSLSYGLYHYFSYQASLIRTPVTIIATIRSPQISDTINIDNTSNLTIPTSPPATNESNAIIGTGYQRQLWQVVAIQPFSDEASLDNTGGENEGQENEALNSQNFPLVTQADTGLVNVPFKVLATANLNKHPEWLPILNNLEPNQTLTVKLALEPIAIIPKIKAANFSQITLGFNEALWLRQRDVQAKAQVLDINVFDPKALDSQPKHAKFPTDNPLPNKHSALSLATDLPPTSFSQAVHHQIEQIRWQLRQKMLLFLQKQLTQNNTQDMLAHTQLHAQSTAILLSLLTGDTGLLSTDIKHLYQVTGISHLLAISGPHVMMLASILAFLGVVIIKLLMPKLLFRLPAQLLLLWISVAVSFAYALLVGFELPAQRTVWMLLLVTLSVQWLLPLSAYRVLAWVGLLMLWLDTTAVLQAGFWLSFVAVGLLINFSQSFAVQDAVQATDSQKIDINQGWHWFWQGTKQLFLLQLWLFILMMPVVVWFFGKISLIAIVVNLIAVPLLGLVIVPLDILAGVLAFFPVIGEWASQLIWQGLSANLRVFHRSLQSLVESGFAKQVYIGLSVPQLILLALMVLIWVLPRRLVPRLLLIPLLLAVMAVSYQRHANLPSQLIVLDDTRLSITLWQNHGKNWLIFAENTTDLPDKLPDVLLEKPISSKVSKKPLATADIMENEIYPLLAKYEVTSLSGVISQTPSTAVNDMVQQLAKTTPIQQYWLAGYDPQLPTNSDFSFNNITPKPCIVGQKATFAPFDTANSLQNPSQIEAITGWQLNESLLGTPLTPKEKWQTQTCFIRLQTAEPTKNTAIIMAGNSEIPLQMAQALCQIQPVKLLISPATTPLSQTWLNTTQPRDIQLISGRFSQPSEDSQFAIAGFIADSQTAQKPVNLQQSSSVGNVTYDF